MYAIFTGFEMLRMIIGSFLQGHCLAYPSMSSMSKNSLGGNMSLGELIITLGMLDNAYANNLMRMKLYIKS